MLILSTVIVLAPAFDVLPIPLETPSFEYIYNGSPPSTGEESLRLELMLETENDVVDVDEWFETYVDAWPSAQFHRGGLATAFVRDAPPAGIQARISIPGGEYMYLDKVINSDDAVIAFYGDAPNQYNVVLDSQILVIMEYGTFRIVDALDFLSYTRYTDEFSDPEEDIFTLQELQWAELSDGVLYVCTMHRTYASSSLGRNAYITAIDMESLQILWRTDPLVCNSHNFILAGDNIICGYGFTNEEDFVYVLDRLTGEVTQTISVITAPEYFHRSGNVIYVRCYNRNCVFRIV